MSLNKEKGEEYYVAGMDNRDLRYLVDNRLLYPQRKYHEPVDRGSRYSRSGILDRYEDSGLTND